MNLRDAAKTQGILQEARLIRLMQSGCPRAPGGGFAGAVLAFARARPRRSRSAPGGRREILPAPWRRRDRMPRASARFPPAPERRQPNAKLLLSMSDTDSFGARSKRVAETGARSSSDKPSSGEAQLRERCEVGDAIRGIGANRRHARERRRARSKRATSSGRTPVRPPAMLLMSTTRQARTAGSAAGGPGNPSPR